MGAKKADGAALSITIQENAIKKTLDKRFAIPLVLPFLVIQYTHMDLKKN